MLLKERKIDRKIIKGKITELEDEHTKDKLKPDRKTS